MVKGFTRDGKFHPTTSSSGVKRKKRIEPKEMLSPTGGVKMHLSKRTEGIRLKREGKKTKSEIQLDRWQEKLRQQETREKRDHGIPQKRSGLNKVTIMEFTKKGKPYSPRLFQVNMNGKGAYFPSNKALSIEYAENMIETAKSADKRGHKIGT